MIELEKTYLAKEIPKGLKDCKHKEIIDIYIPKSTEHPHIRIRKNGDRFEMTKKEPVEVKDTSRQLEQTIILTEEEFNELKKIDGKVVHKIRYQYYYEGKMGEIDIFQGSLKGLVIVDFEFKTVKEKDSFNMPNFCLVDVTQEKFTAGGMLAGKTYRGIEKELKKFNYAKLNFD